MGNNSYYTIFQATVIGAYNLGKLDKELLAVLMEPYRGTDIDSGGSYDLTAKDGLDVEEVCIKTMVGRVPTRPRLPMDYKKWTVAQDKENEAYNEAMGEAFGAITDQFGWC